MTSLRTMAVAPAAILLAVLTSAAGSPGVQPGTADGAELVKTGWWWAANETALDETPLAPPQPSAPNVPEGALPVSAVNGDPEKFSAIEFALDTEEGEVPEQATLVLRENGDPGATVGADAAVVWACPVTEAFWADGASAAWTARPAYDCDVASAPGERNAKGLWTFDLTAIAATWSADGGKGSVALVEGVEAPVGFQVAFDGVAAEGIGYRFLSGEGGDNEAPLAEQRESRAGAPPPSAGDGGASGGIASSSLSDGGAGLATPAGTAELTPVEDGGAVAVPEVAAPAATAETATTATTPVAAYAPAWYSGLPVGGYLLLPFAAVLAYLLMLALGPDAQPAVGSSRRGVGRALERLRAAGTARTRGRS